MKSSHPIRHTYTGMPGAAEDIAVQVFDMTAEEVAEAPALYDLCAFALTEDRAPTAPAPVEEGIISWCVAMAAESPSARAALIRVREQGWHVGFSDLCGAGFHIDFTRRAVILDNATMPPAALAGSVYFRNALLLSFFRAMRDIWHENRCGAFEDGYMPEQVLMLERVRAADADVFAMLAAWELRGAGHTDVWRNLLGAPEGDLAMIFSRYLERDPASLYDGGALAHAFRQWYADHERINACDHRTLEALDDMLLSSPVRNPFGNHEMTDATIEELSVLPDGICYLAGLGRTIMADPLFAGLNDEVNQTHLFHIMRDLEVTMVNNVPFRDSKLARRIFPGADTVRTSR